MRRVLACLALLFVAAGSRPEGAKLLLAVNTFEQGGKRRTYVEPIAFVSREPYGKRDAVFQRPISRELREDAYIKRFYRVGTRYAIYRGGVSDGFVTITDSDHNTCEEVNRLALETSDYTPPRTWRGASGIAVGSLKLWSIVDYEDFDGDGVDELVVAEHGWEWTSYQILKRHHEGTWDVIYSGGGSGC